MQTAGAFAVIFDAAKNVLLCHRRDRDQWNLPGGRVEPHQSPWQAVIREVKEEVCLDVRVDRLLGMYWVPSRSDLVFNFLCVVQKGSPATSSEADEVRWFGRHDIPHNTLRRHVQRIHDAYATPGVVLLRTQD